MVKRCAGLTPQIGRARIPAEFIIYVFECCVSIGPPSDTNVEDFIAKCFKAYKKLFVASDGDFSLKTVLYKFLKGSHCYDAVHKIKGVATVVSIFDLLQRLVLS